MSDDTKTPAPTFTPTGHEAYDKLLETLPDMAPPGADAVKRWRGGMVLDLHGLLTAVRELRQTVGILVERHLLGMSLEYLVQHLAERDAKLGEQVWAIQGVLGRYDDVCKLIPKTLRSGDLRDAFKMDGAELVAYVKERYGLDLTEMRTEVDASVAAAREAAKQPPPAPTIHHLHQGRSACDMTERYGVPGEWPDRHVWSDDWANVTCEACKDADLQRLNTALPTQRQIKGGPTHLKLRKRDKTSVCGIALYPAFKKGGRFWTLSPVLVDCKNCLRRRP